jgi:hypothetical protein
MGFFSSKDRASARAKGRVSARVNARNKAAATSLKSASSMKSYTSDASDVKSSPIKSRSPSPEKSSQSPIKHPPSPMKSVPSPIKSILVDSAARESQSGDSPTEKPVKSVVIDAAAFECSTASSAAMTDSASYSPTEQKQNLNEYNGDEIVDSLKALHKIIEEANAVIKAYEETPPPIVPAMINESSTKAASDAKGKGGSSRFSSKKIKGPTPAEVAAEKTEAARVAQVAQESLRQRTKNVAGKTKEEVFVWATQSLMRELDLVMPIFLDKKYRVNVETMTAEEAELLAENTEVETLMPVTSSFLRKIDKSVDAIIAREEAEEEQSRGGKVVKKNDCGVLECMKPNLGEKEKRELTPAQKKLAKELEDDDRSAIVLAADMAEEFMQSLNGDENHHKTDEAIYTRDVSLLAAK